MDEMDEKSEIIMNIESRNNSINRYFDCQIFDLAADFQRKSAYFIAYDLADKIGL